MSKTKKEKPLTLDDLANYNQEILFPYLHENFAPKETVDKILTGQDKILEELEKLTIEKTVGDVQDKRKTKVLEIHNGALKRNKILSPEETLEVDQLGAF